MTEANDKEQRLAEALRANLRRRKAQAREAADVEKPSEAVAPVPAKAAP